METMRRRGPEAWWGWCEWWKWMLAGWHSSWTGLQWVWDGMPAASVLGRACQLDVGTSMRTRAADWMWREEQQQQRRRWQCSTRASGAGWRRLSAACWACCSWWPSCSSTSSSSSKFLVLGCTSSSSSSDLLAATGERDRQTGRHAAQSRAHEPTKSLNSSDSTMRVKVSRRFSHIAFCTTEIDWSAWNDNLQLVSSSSFIGPIPWGHSGPLCHALSLSLSSLSWTSMRRRRATVPLATSGE